jgi:hypothetical protein
MAKFLRCIFTCTVFITILFNVALIGQSKNEKRVPPSPILHEEHEKIEGKYIPIKPEDQKFSPPYNRVFSNGFTITQVNVSGSGQNIIGDAANEPSLAVDPTNPNRMAIGWRQFNTISSNFRQAGYGYTTDGGQTWTAENTNVPGILISVYLTRNLAGNEWEFYAAGTGGTIIRNNFSVIPVELASFSASVTDNKTVLLTWSTASETNNSGFEIERKTGNTWKKIGFVTGSGNSAAPKSYSFTDELRIISGGRFFEYRLKQIDFDGTSSYSGVVSVELNLMPENFELFQNYPNPFNPSTTIKYALPVESKVTIQIFNISGELIAEPINGVLAAGYHENIFDASKLPSGIYICKMNANALNNTGNLTAVRKMLLIK